jgi:MazG family protein
MSNIERLLEIMATLRNKEHGCKWDLKQTFNSLIPYTLEEVYEVADAIERGNMEEFRDELGDLLFIIIFHSQIAQDNGLFDFDDVAKVIGDKIIKRHPHIFGNEKSGGKTPEEVLAQYNKIKKEERRKNLRACECKNIFANIYSSIPKNLPELKRSQKIQHRTDESINFLYNEIKDVIQDVRDELAELEVELKNGDEQRIKEELGDVIFAVCRIGNKFNIDSEDALRHSNNEFQKRFKFIGDKLEEAGIDPEDADTELLDKLWKEAKSFKSNN